MKRVIVIGLDGFDPKIVEVMQQTGDLPNLSALGAAGGYSCIQTTYPAQTPVAWSTFATGRNPGGHGIFDFLNRDPNTYLPILGLSRYEQKNAFSPPQVMNMRRGMPMWELLTKAGLPSTVIRCPCTYPPDELNGRMLAGVGVPDLRGGLGTSTFYSSRDGIRAEHSERVVRVTISNDSINTHLIGPRNPKTRNDIPLDVRIDIDRTTQKVTLHSNGQPNCLEIYEGQWSDWLKVKFKLGFLQSVRGTLRFNLVRLDPEFELYASPINFDTEAPLFPISSPQEYASEIEARMGTYYTLGMAEDHDGLINGRIDEAAFLKQCDLVMHERKKMMFDELERFDRGLFFCLYDTPDRLQHMFWRYRDPGHPANRTGFMDDYKDAIENHYRACDAVIGEAREFVDEDTLFIVLSDHGMTSFRRGLNLNTWLYTNGYLALKNGYLPGESNGEFFRNIDWDHSKAYALGLAGIYLNQKGREANGILDREEAEITKDELVEALGGLIDQDNGEHVIHSVVPKEELYIGPYVHEAPDVIINFNKGYRVSWGTPLGGVPEGIFEDNVKKWSGDHVVNPEMVPGVLFMNRTFDGTEADLLDLAPTILKALGVPKGKDMEGRDLLA
jgi:predicted AlkP superfamily phosphohydrolase/phosphomutase